MIKNKPAGGLKSTKNSSPSPANDTAITKKDDYGSNFFTQSNYKKVSNFLNESSKKAKQQQQQKISECNYWVCKILDSVTIADTLKYEDYNIVSETGDSIFYDPFLSSNIFNHKKLAGQQVYLSENNIRDIDIVQNELEKHLNGVNFDKNEY